jgi:hypothetical protein
MLKREKTTVKEKSIMALNNIAELYETKFIDNQILDINYRNALSGYIFSNEELENLIEIVNKIEDDDLIELTQLFERIANYENIIIKMVSYFENAPLKNNYISPEQAIINIFGKNERFDIGQTTIYNIRMFRKLIELLKEYFDDSNKITKVIIFAMNNRYKEVQRRNYEIEQMMKSIETKEILSHFKQRVKVVEHESVSIIKRIDKYNERFNELDREIADRIDKVVRESKINAASEIGKLAEMKKKAEELYNFVTDASITGGFSEYAKESKKAYHMYIMGAIMCFIILIICTIWFLILNQNSVISVSQSLIRIAMLSVLSAPVAFCIKESSKHLRLANMYKKIELDLLAVDPFTENLSKEDSEKVKLLLSERIFGRFDIIDNKNMESDKNSLSVSNLHLIENIVESIKTIMTNK